MIPTREKITQWEWYYSDNNLPVMREIVFFIEYNYYDIFTQWWMETDNMDIKRFSDGSKVTVLERGTVHYSNLQE